MSNPLFNSLTNNRQIDPLQSMASDVQRLSQQLNGQNPSERIQQMVKAGNVNPDQVSQAYAMANRLAGMMSRFFPR